MKYRGNGSVQSTNVPTLSNNKERIDNNIYRCMVIEIKFTDSSANITGNDDNPRVMYDVVVLGGAKAGRRINNCRMMNRYASKHSYYERTLRKSSKKLGEVKLQDHDGEVVWVMFNQGNVLYPVIVGCDESIETTSAGEATKADSPREVMEFNGVKFEINNKGEYTITRAGRSEFTAEEGKYVPNADTVLAQMTLKRNNIVFLDPTKTFTMNNPDEFYTRTYKTGMEIKEDGKNDKMTVTMAGGLSMEINGKDDKVSMTTSGGVSIDVDGKNNKITMTAGSTIVEIDGASGKVSIKGDFIDLGKTVTDFVTKFNQLATAFNSHTHQFIDFTPVPVTNITMPPTLPLLVNVGSQTVQVQD